MEEDMIIQAGSVVVHRPSGTQWFVLGVNKSIGRICVAGTEPTVLQIDECDLVDSGKGLTVSERKSREAVFGPEWV